jgi:fructoselysine 6-kinase
MKVAAVGFVCIDVYDRQNRLYPTGNGVDFIINLKKLSPVQASVVSAVGNDAYGQLMLTKLQGLEIDTSHLQVRDGKTAVIKMELKGNDRIHGERIRGVMDSFAPTEDDLEFIKGHDLIHTDLTGRVLNRLPLMKADGAEVLFDFSIKHNNPDNAQILPYVDYALFSFDQRDKRDAELADFMKWAQSFGPKIVIATLGVNGSLAYDGKRFYEAGIVPAETVNTVGAGDSFIAGFMHGIINRWDIGECLKSGAAMAAKIVSQFDPY